MQRKEFIKKSLAALTVMHNLPVLNLFGSDPAEFLSPTDISKLNNVDDVLKKDFIELVDWMKKNGWEEFIMRELKLKSIPWNSDEALCWTLKYIPREEPLNGFDDFGGNKLIHPGNPSMSLLYHVLASPRVKDNLIQSYPCTKQLDILENYIYNLQKDDKYFEGKNKENLFLMVLSYEYRPAYKTPALGLNNFEYDRENFPKHAQFVYSRSGISRIGNQPLHYDAVSRSYTNKPENPSKEREIAVTPARFALFVVELVKIKKDSTDSIKVMNVQKKEYTNMGDRHFIRPIKKVFNNENLKITFGQYHLNQKLYKFSQFELKKKKIEDVNSDQMWTVNTFPFKRIDATDDQDQDLGTVNDKKMVELITKGSSVLLNPIHNELIRVAEQNQKELSFYVEPKWARRYNALKLTNKNNVDIYDSIFTEFIFRRSRTTSRFRAMRNAPLFVNIKYEKDNNGGVVHLDESQADMEGKINRGDYRALLFEDSMCDGCVSATIKFTDKSKDKIVSDCFEKHKVLAAYSIVAAPDFFPYLDSNDIRMYYHKDVNELETYTKSQQVQADDLAEVNDEHFLEGGSLNLSGIRQRGNPDILEPFTKDQAFKSCFQMDKSFDTLVAVVANVEKNVLAIKDRTFNFNLARDYTTNSYLPDTGTGIFFPGWDVTYSGNKKNPYFGTFGLGSPFPEDMKLCAAANGMWPVSSPDAGRTFQGSLEAFPILGRPNTSIPLMDYEIGIHPNSPHVKHHNESANYGWDGEQGPFLGYNKKKELCVNFTDIGRADYLENLLNPTIGFNMSDLRKMDTLELMMRMDCYKQAIKSFDNVNRIYKTNYWLVSAEKVDHWELGAKGLGIPNDLIGSDNNWAKNTKSLTGEGFLFVFAKTKVKCLEEELESPNSKRRNQLISKLVICKVSNTNPVQVVWCKFDRNIPKNQNDIIWHNE